MSLNNPRSQYCQEYAIDHLHLTIIRKKLNKQVYIFQYIITFYILIMVLNILDNFKLMEETAILQTSQQTLEFKYSYEQSEQKGYFSLIVNLQRRTTKQQSRKEMYVLDKFALIMLTKKYNQPYTVDSLKKILSNQVLFSLTHDQRLMIKQLWWVLKPMQKHKYSQISFETSLALLAFSVIEYIRDDCKETGGYVHPHKYPRPRRERILQFIHDKYPSAHPIAKLKISAFFDFEIASRWGEKYNANIFCQEGFENGSFGEYIVYNPTSFTTKIFVKIWLDLYGSCLLYGNIGIGKSFSISLIVQLTKIIMRFRCSHDHLISEFLQHLTSSQKQNLQHLNYFIYLTIKQNYLHQQQYLRVIGKQIEHNYQGPWSPDKLVQALKKLMEKVNIVIVVDQINYYYTIMQNICKYSKESQTYMTSESKYYAFTRAISTFRRAHIRIYFISSLNSHITLWTTIYAKNVYFRKLLQSRPHIIEISQQIKSEKCYIAQIIQKQIQICSYESMLTQEEIQQIQDDVIKRIKQSKISDQIQKQTEQQLLQKMSIILFQIEKFRFSIRQKNLGVKTFREQIQVDKFFQINWKQIVESIGFDQRNFINRQFSYRRIADYYQNIEPQIGYSRLKMNTYEGIKFKHLNEEFLDYLSHIFQFTFNQSRKKQLKFMLTGNQKDKYYKYQFMELFKNAALTQLQEEKYTNSPSFQCKIPEHMNVPQHFEKYINQESAYVDEKNVTIFLTPQFLLYIFQSIEEKSASDKDILSMLLSNYKYNRSIIHSIFPKICTKLLTNNQTSLILLERQQYRQFIIQNSNNYTFVHFDFQNYSFRQRFQDIFKQFDKSSTPESIWITAIPKLPKPSIKMCMKSDKNKLIDCILISRKKTEQGLQFQFLSIGVSVSLSRQLIQQKIKKTDQLFTSQLTYFNDDNHEGIKISFNHFFIIPKQMMRYYQANKLTNTRCIFHVASIKEARINLDNTFSQEARIQKQIFEQIKANCQHL